jgi:acyl carrier protein
MTGDGIRRNLSSFLERAFKDRPLRDDEDMFALGFGNSLFAMELVEYVERVFGIEIGEEDLDMENFRTINAIGSLVERKRLGRAS